MRFRDWIIIFVCVFASIGLLMLSSARLDSIHESRQELGLVHKASSLENAPPALAFATMAMGAFRGLVVDILWIRAEKLKEEGQFFDAKQIAEWITVLQPRFSSVWDFQAWNMAYNISVAMPASQWEERWRWVRNGYELLRDKGIEQNPQSIILYRSLAWIFQHKMGGVTDDCHLHYKRELALEMRRLLGEHPDRAYFSQLAAAPKELSEVMKDPEIAAMASELAAADKVFGNKDKLVRNYLALRSSPDKFAPEAHEVINRFREKAALGEFDIFARAYSLRNEWKLEPEFMERLNNKFGPVPLDDPNDHMPLEWENAHVHAIYWAERGLEVAGKPGEYSVDEKNTDRIVFHSLKELFRTGKLFIYPVPGEVSRVFVRPDLRMFDVCDKEWIRRIEKYEALEKSNPKAVRTGHKNMLVDAVLMFYQVGNVAKAKKVYDELRQRYMHDDFKVSLSRFVKGRLVKEIQEITIFEATPQIMMTLREAYFRYAMRDDDEAFGRESFAKFLHGFYMAELGGEESGRIDLPDFAVMKYLAFRSFMEDEFYPAYLRRNLLGRISVERPELMKKLQEQELELFERLEKANQQR